MGMRRVLSLMSASTYQHRKALLGTPSVPQVSERETNTCGSWWCTTTPSCITQFGVARSYLTWIPWFRGKPQPPTTQLKHWVQGSFAAFLLGLANARCTVKAGLFFYEKQFFSTCTFGSRGTIQIKEPLQKDALFLWKGLHLWREIWQPMKAVSCCKSVQKSEKGTACRGWTEPM